MDVNSLLLFLQVVEAGSLAEAARKSGVPKSTLSRKLRALEDELGVRLLQRTSRKLGLTEPGRRLADHARDVSATLDRARRDVRARGDEPRGRVRVTASVSLGERFLSPILTDFLERYPRVQLEVVLSPARADLIAEEIDVAIRIGDPDPTSSMIARRITSAALYLCASPRYLAEHGTPETVEELATHPAIVYRADREPAGWLLEGPGEARARVTPPTRMVVNSHPTGRAAVLAGLGIGALPAPWCADDLDAGRLVRVLPEHRTPLKWVYAAFPSRDLPAAVRAFIDFVAPRLERVPLVLPEDAEAASQRGARGA